MMSTAPYLGERKMYRLRIGRRRGGIVTGRVAALAACMWVAAAVAAVMAGEPSTAPDVPIVFTQVPIALTPAAGSSYNAKRPSGAVERSSIEIGSRVAWPAGNLTRGSRIALFEAANSDEGFRTLTPDFFAAAHTDVSFDASRILFIGQRASDDSPAVYEMSADGSGVRLVTRGPGPCTEAVYLSTLFTLDADHPVHQIALRATLPGGKSGALYTCHLDGSHLRRITFTPFDVSDPYPLSDGRLLFSVWTSADADSATQTDSAIGRSAALFTIHPDGTDVFPFAGMHAAPAVRSMPCETLDDWVVYVESEPGATESGGSLAAVPRTRSLNHHRTVASAEAGTYSSPAPMPDGRLLASYKPHGGTYGVYLLDPFVGDGGSLQLPTDGRRIAKIYDDPAWDEVDAVPVAPRREPAGRSSVVDDSAEWGHLYCLNVYLSDREAAEALQPGQVDRVRVLRGMLDRPTSPDSERTVRGAADPPTASAPSGAGGGAHPETTLGEAHLAEDGSFFLEVPARTPLRLETLDKNGRVLQSMRSWIWVMPQEKRGCIGCHEDRELTPPNRHVFALWRQPQRLGITSGSPHHQLKKNGKEQEPGRASADDGAGMVGASGYASATPREPDAPSAVDESLAGERGEARRFDHPTAEAVGHPDAVGRPNAEAVGRPQAVGQPVAVGDWQDEFPLYVGQQVCLECHRAGHSAKPCAAPPAPAHLRAFEALLRPEANHIAFLSGVSDSPTQSALCLGCHSTAADDGPRWTAKTFRFEDGVQCEACHNAGSRHVRAHAGGRTSEGSVRTVDPTQADSVRAADPTVGRSFEGAAMRPGDRTFCDTCHIQKTSHMEVLERGYRVPAADRLYKTPVNLAISPDGARLYAVCEHADSVMVIDLASGTVMAEVAVGRRPQDVSVSPDGKTIYVSNRFGADVTVIDAETLEVVATIPVGHEPHGLATDVSGEHLYVLNTGQDSISVIDTVTRKEVKRLAGGSGPWSLARAPDGRSMFATSVRPNSAPFRDPPRSEVTEVDLARGVVSQRHVVEDANMLQGVAVVPGRDVALFTLMRTKNLVPITRMAQGWTITNGLGVIGPDGRVDQVLLDRPNDYFPDPVDVDVSPDGRYALVVSGGADEVAVVDIDALLATIEEATDEERRDVLPNHLGLAERFVFGRIKVGHNPRAVVYASDGRHAYVAEALDDAVAIIDAHEFRVVGRILLGGPGEVTERRRGERLFHSAANAFGRQFSCRSCHPDGHVNGLSFDIEADGIGLHPVDNLTLRGIADTAPFKWEGTNPSLQRQCGARLAVFFTRLQPYTPEELAALVRYMYTIERPPNHNRHPAGLTLAQRRGKAVFDRATDNFGRSLKPDQQCAHCHSGVYRTNRKVTVSATSMWFDAPFDVEPSWLHEAGEFGDLGTFYFPDVGVPQKDLDTPHLDNVYSSPPYLHNGAAATLEEIWTRFNILGGHGASGDWTREQLNDLIEYLKVQ